MLAHLLWGYNCGQVGEVLLSLLGTEENVGLVQYGYGAEQNDVGYSPTTPMIEWCGAE